MNRLIANTETRIRKMPAVNLQTRMIFPEPANPSSSLAAVPPGENTEPAHIGTLLEPMQAIFRHPNRNRLIADLFKNYR